MKMNIKKVKFIFFIVIFTIIFSSCSNIQKAKESDKNMLETVKINSPVEYTINIVDLDTHDSINKAYVSVLEVNKKYLVSEQFNKITLPAIEYKDLSKYPHGYSMITIAEGYLPRIDHNFIAASGTITLELKKIPNEPSNEAYTEYFHGAAMNEVAGIIEYYKEISAEKD
jgi:hypothetical protein